MRFARRSRGQNGRISTISNFSLIFCLFLLFIENSRAENVENITKPTTTTATISQTTRPVYKNLAKLFRRLLWPRNWRNPTRDLPHRVTTTELVERAGFRIETSYVTTEDGYILALDRILLPKSEEIDAKNNNETEKEKKPAVLLFTGLSGCGDIWVAGIPENSLAFILTRLNYDVYLANPRGCVYSRNHTSKDPDLKASGYWNFSWHEVGFFDLKAITDFILMETGQPKLNYIGLSMGTTVNYVLLSERPEYNKKFNMSISLGASAFSENALHPGYIPFRHFPKNFISRLFNTPPSMEVLPQTSILQHFYIELCNIPQLEEFCWNLNFGQVGFDFCQQSGQNLVSNLLDVYPSSTSLWMAFHYLQIANSRIFRKFDHGKRQNVLIYGSPNPPAYNLSNIDSPQILFHSDNDWTSSPKDAAKLASMFSPKAKTMMCRVKYPDWNHFDYIVGKDVNLLVNDRIIQVLRGNSCWKNGDPEDDKLDEDIQCPDVKTGRATGLNSFFQGLDRQVRQRRF